MVSLLLFLLYLSYQNRLATSRVHQTAAKIFWHAFEIALKSTVCTGKRLEKLRGPKRD